MTDREKFKAEIATLRAKSDQSTSEYAEGCRDTCNKLLSIIDSMQEEEPAHPATKTNEQDAEWVKEIESMPKEELLEKFKKYEQDAPTPKTLDHGLINDYFISAEESLGISEEEYSKIVDACIFGDAEPASDEIGNYDHEKVDKALLP